ncbi:MAG: OmpA family protein [Chitinophagales bacterium]
MNKKYQLEVGKDGYFKKIHCFKHYGHPRKCRYHIQEHHMNAIQVGKSYELANILYDFGKATLRDESKLVLDELINILQENPSIIIELSAHTDNIGSDESNLKLSQARAESCVAYLISKGISKSRLSAKGYGEAVPIAPNENEDGSDNEEGRQKNRRTEFKVLKSF